MNRVDRLFGYLLLLQSRGLVRARDLAERFEVSERTVYRDVQALSEVGVPVVSLPGEGYRLSEGYYLPPIAFSPDEARALSVAISMMTGLTAPGRTKDAARTALEKVRAVLPAETLQDLATLESMFRFYPLDNPPLDLEDDKLLQLEHAIHGRRLVHLRYHSYSGNEVSDRDVEPLELLLLDRVWILAAYCRLRQAPRAFRLDRIDAFDVLDQRFRPRGEVVESSHPSGAKVVVRFAPEVARWIRERQHFSYAGDLKTEEDGAVVMLYRPSGFREIEGWLLSWGDGMEVLAPAELRGRLATAAAKILERHARPDPEGPSRARSAEAAR